MATRIEITERTKRVVTCHRKDRLVGMQAGHQNGPRSCHENQTCHSLMGKHPCQIFLYALSNNAGCMESFK